MDKNKNLKVRFAPSPTGQVHIGNIRTAIFNYLFARNGNGEFVIRVEDTDLERSTQDAIDKLFECMEWLGLDYDGDIFYQSKHADEHIAAAEQLINTGSAYRPAPKSEGEKVPVLFRIPWDTDNNPAVNIVGHVEITVHPDEPVKIDSTGISYAQVSKKGKPIPMAASLAGFHKLKITDIEDNILFYMDENISSILSSGESFSITGAAKFAFERREVFFDDIIKGKLAKPIDTMKDLVIVRSDGSPVFHLANVIDDAAQEITHIVRGDDHVENTYRHIFLFQALGKEAPAYGHMPMIVNNQGKPLSKRDGDAFVGDFRDKGFLAPALFNYLAFLGWSPGDDREKMSKEELIEAFSIERVLSSPAKFDAVKLANINGQYIAELATAKFAEIVANFAKNSEDQTITAWIESNPQQFNAVAELMQPRTKMLSDIKSWSYFFSDTIEYNEKEKKKTLKPEIMPLLSNLKDKLAAVANFAESEIETALRETEQDAGLPEGKLNKPFRVAITGSGSGADLIQTALIIGKEKVINRILRLHN
jgi:glutamyl-tRNA synthetase